MDVKAYIIEYILGSLEYGITPQELIDDEGFPLTPLYLESIGFTNEDFTLVKYTPTILLNNGFTSVNFQNTGYNQYFILEASGYKYVDFSNANISPQTLQQNGFVIDDFSYCNYTVFILEELVFTYIDFSNSGYTVQFLKQEGFTITNFSNTGYTPFILEQYGFNYIDFYDTGYTPSYLKQYFTNINFTNTGYTIPYLVTNGLSAVDISNAGYNNYYVLEAAGYKYVDFSNANISPQTLEQAGFLIVDFSFCLYSPQILQQLGFTITNFSNTGYTVQILKDSGFTITDFSNTGYTPLILLDLGFTITDFSNTGYTVQILKESGFTYIEFSSSGYTPLYLKEQGFLITDFSDCGYNPLMLKQGGFNKVDFSACGYGIQDLLNGGFYGSDFYYTGYTAHDLYNFGLKKQDFARIYYDTVYFIEANFTKAEYIDIGYTIADLQDADNWNTIYNFASKTRYIAAGYTPLDLYLGGVTKKSLPPKLPFGDSILFFSHGFVDLGYTIQELVNGGVSPFLQNSGYSALELYAAGVQKSVFDATGFSVYDLLDVLTAQQVIDLGYSEQIVNAYRTFIFQISTTSWDSSSNQPHKYPINNNVYSLQDISFTEVRNSFGITTVTITWKQDISGNEFDDAIFINAEIEDTYFDQSNNGFIDSSTNDGFSLNPSTIPYYNDPTFIIKQFGGIPFSINSAINSNYFQGYNFGGKIQAFDSPRFLPSTSFYNAFIKSTGSSSNSNTTSYILPGDFQNIASWKTYHVTDLRNAFKDSINFHERIGQWNFSQIRGRYMENIISGTGYNPIQTSIFLQDLSNNVSLQSDLSLGTIPNYYITTKTSAAIQNLSRKNISFRSTGIIPNISSFRTDYMSFGYTSFSALLTDTRIAGFTVNDLSVLITSGNAANKLSILESFRFAGYMISEIQPLSIYNLMDYYNAGYPLSDFINSGYTAFSLRTLSTTPGFGPFYYYLLGYIRPDLKTVFNLNELINAGYNITQLIQIGYSLINLINTPNIEYTILDFTSAGISLTDISNASVLNENLSLTNLSNYDSSGAYLLKENNINVIDLSNIGYTIPQILSLNYSLADLRDASYSISYIKNYEEFTDLSYTAAGYSLTDISNAGFPLSNLLTRTPLPTILIQNNITVTDLSLVGYDCSFIANNFKYGISDLKGANFNIQQIFNTNLFQLSDFTNAGFSASQLKTVGYTDTQLAPYYSLQQLIATYNIGNLMLLPADISNLRVAGYSITDLSNALNTQYMTYFNQQWFAGGYTLTDLKNAGNSLIKIYRQLAGSEFYPYNSDFNEESTTLMTELINIFPINTLLEKGFFFSDLYINYKIPLNILQTLGYSSRQIATTNSYVKYVKAFSQQFLMYTDVSLVTVQMLHDAGFTADQLIGNNISTKQDILNIIQELNFFYTHPNNTDGTNYYSIGHYYFISIIINNSAIQPFDDNFLISTTPPFQYNFNTFKPFGTTSLLGPGTDPNFDELSYYQPLEYNPFGFIYQGINLPGTVYLLDKNFYYTDVSNGLKTTYNQVNVYDNGWLTLGFYDYTNPDILLNIYTPTLALRFFPFPVNRTTISRVYAFWKSNNINSSILEFIVNGEDINGQQFQITIKIYDYGLITLCNGDGDSILYNPNTLRYENPDPVLIGLGSSVQYYHPPMEYTYDVSSNIVISQMYDTLRIDLRYGVQDPSNGIYIQKSVNQLGYLASELQGIYSASELKSAGFSSLNLRNIGYSANQVYDLSYAPFDIVTSYNINFNISEILNYQ